MSATTPRARGNFVATDLLSDAAVRVVFDDLQPGEIEACHSTQTHEAAEALHYALIDGEDVHFISIPVKVLVNPTLSQRLVTAIQTYSSNYQAPSQMESK
jgi:hypothetical protein